MVFLQSSPNRQFQIRQRIRKISHCGRCYLERRNGASYRVNVNADAVGTETSGLDHRSASADKRIEDSHSGQVRTTIVRAPEIITGFNT